ncbi:MAG: amidohydrolase [Flavobacteriaceae bacterium]|jgi:predicted amidohydrolase YtcJ|nr:amidohydrolase [Flavobacteriaceae bacterium]
MTKRYDLHLLKKIAVKIPLIGALLFGSILFYSCQEKVDLIVHNANVYTLNKNNIKATAFAVKDGKFVAVGGEELLEKYNTKKTLNANELPVYPGFIDAHCHFLSLGLMQSQLDLTGTKSFDEILLKLENFSKDNSSKFILGHGWDQNDWENQAFPTKEKLDTLFPDTPVVLERIDGHAFLVNQKALDLAGITTDSDSQGGQIIKANGTLTGLLIDGPMELISAILPKPTIEEKVKALKAAEAIALANGLTTVDDAGLSKEDVLLIDSLYKKGELKIRMYAMLSNTQENRDYFLANGPIKTDYLTVRSFKAYTDGALGSRGAVLKAPYSDAPEEFGTLVTPIDSLEKLAYRLSTSSFQLNTHAIGDSAVAATLNIYRKALVFQNDPRWRIEHAQILDTTDIKLFNYKILPSVQPTHAISDMDWAEDRIGADRMPGAYAFKALLDQSNRIALGTDFPVENVSPFATFHAAVVRKKSDETPEEGFLSENALTRMEALKGMTIWAAYANFEEDQKGSIEVGKNADFVMLDRDLIKISDRRILSTRVVATIINGNVAYSNRFQ